MKMYVKWVVEHQMSYTFAHKLNYFQTGGEISLNLIKLSLQYKHIKDIKL